MRVNREFSPEIAQRLETIRELDLELLLSQYPENSEEAFELTDWQLKGVEEAERSLAEGKTIPHEAISAWIDSLDTDNPLPRPTCK